MKARFFLFYLALAILYMWTRNPHPEFGDSIGFVYYALTGFDWATNATSHFLYTNINHLLVLILPFFSPVFVLSIVSLIFGLLTVEQVRKLSLEVNGHRTFAYLAAGIFALGFSWWRQVVTIEVYTMQLFWVSRMLVLMARDWNAQTYRRGKGVSILFGLAMLTHIQNILLLPLFLTYGWRGRKKGYKVWQSLLVMVLFGVLFVPPLLLETNSISAIFFDRQFQGAVTQFDWLTTLKGFLRSLAYLVFNFHIWLIPLFWGLQKMLKERNSFLWALLLTALLFWGFAMRYNVTDNYVFFLLPYVVLALISAEGFLAIFQLPWFSRATIRQRRVWVVLLPLLAIPIYSLSLLLLNQSASARQWAEPKTYKGGLQYYVWPGRSQAPDPLRLAKEIKQGLQPMIPDFDRYEKALQLAELMEAPYE